MAEGEFDYGKKIGVWAYYYNSTGETRMTGNYTSGKRDGDWKYYSSKGTLAKVVTYKMGEAINTKVPNTTTLADNVSN
jgi:antitoxin component YwqK of YwqJK toxin-antitoxin module